MKSSAETARRDAARPKETAARLRIRIVPRGAKAEISAKAAEIITTT